MANSFKKLWKGAVAQIEGVRDQVEKTVKASGQNARHQFEKEFDRLRIERDRLLVTLGEQTLTWVNKSPVELPSVLKKTVTRLNEVVDSLKPKKAAKAESKAEAAAPKAAASKPVKKKKAAAPKKKAAAPAKAAAPKRVNKAPVSKKPLEE